MEGRREVGREVSGVLYPLVGGLRFKATSPYPPQLPLCERVHERMRKGEREKKREREKERERRWVRKVRAGGRSLFLLAAFIGGLSVQKKARVAERIAAKNEKAKEKEREQGASSESIW